ncbi:Proteinase-activated receptor 3 [Bagarius yarrelli]|uniref:Proteinase-activated receptor 3 n=1 Tax=Bagarius yarrelli TaxID=175774 RepID=A0A556TU38_BAGYA|nr:Proteinase-activated receptor 3 [Bagarius yarrelli]
MANISTIFLLAFLVQTAQGQKQQRDAHDSTSGVRPRTFQGHAIPIELPLPPNSTEMETRSFVDGGPALALSTNSSALYLRSSLSTRVIPSIYVLAIIIGVPANIAILVSIGTKVRSVSAAILCCSLAASDLFLLLSLLLKVQYHFSGNDWTFGEAACRLTIACFYGNLYCSAHTLACMSIKRYLAVVHPFFYKGLPKRACTTWASLGVWLVFSLAMLPSLLVHQSYRIPQLGITTCHDVLPLDASTHNFLVYYNIGLTLFGFLLPLLVTAVCFGSIVWHLNRSHQDWSLYIKASTLVFLIFVVCFSPSSCIHLLHYLRIYTSGDDNFYTYFNVVVCLCCLHCCLDPFLFMLVSKSTGSRLYFMTHKGKMFSIST